MTTATVASNERAPSADSARGSQLTGTGTLLRFILRRDRIRIPVWILGISFVQISAANSYPGLYPTKVDRMAQAAVVGENPAMKAMSGPGHGLDNYTYGAMISNEYLGFMAIFVALMSVLMVVRHTRTEEETGRAELVRANVTGRYAALTATLLAVTVTNVVLGLVVAAGMGGLGVETIDWPGSFVYGAAYVMVGLVFAGLAVVAVQLTGHSRAASGMAGALIGVAFALRAIGDATENNLSWASPIGWAQASAPFVADKWWPLGLGFAVAVVLVVTGFGLSNLRDVGAGLRAERGGAVSASRLLGTPQGFAWRLQRANVMWWGVAMLVAGAAYGSAVDVIDTYEDNETLKQMVQQLGGATLADAWLAMLVTVLSIIVTIFAVIAALRPRREETAGRAESVLATALSRSRWLGSHVIVAMLGGVVLLLVTGLGLGGSAAITSGDRELFWKVIQATLAYAPALWVMVGLAVALFGIAPRLTPLAWALPGYAFAAVYLGGLLDLPGWALDISPYHHVPRMPVADFKAEPLLWLTLIAVGLTAVGFLGFRRRNLQTTS